MSSCVVSTMTNDCIKNTLSAQIGKQDSASVSVEACKANNNNNSLTNLNVQSSCTPDNSLKYNM